MEALGSDISILMHKNASECTRWGKVAFGDKGTLMCFQRLVIVGDSKSIRKFGLLEGRRS